MVNTAVATAERLTAIFNSDQSLRMDYMKLAGNRDDSALFRYPSLVLPNNEIPEIRFNALREYHRAYVLKIADVHSRHPEKQQTFDANRKTIEGMFAQIPSLTADITKLLQDVKALRTQSHNIFKGSLRKRVNHFFTNGDRNLFNEFKHVLKLTENMLRHSSETLRPHASVPLWDSDISKTREEIRIIKFEIACLQSECENQSPVYEEPKDLLSL
jgi:predicted ester cyclase